MVLKRFLLLALVFSLNGEGVSAQNGNKESNLKVAFIYNFTKYIDWDLSGSNEFTIGIIGSSPVYYPLVELSKTKTVNGRKIVIRYFNKPDDITFCNILFIAANSNFSLSSILEKTSRRTLTVSEEAGLAEKGTAFNFLVLNDKLKFEANLKSINATGLKASSQLLKLAIIVDQ